MSVKDLLKEGNVIACRASDPVRCAVQKMYAYNVGSVLVLGDDGSLVGIFTERDLVRLLAEGGNLDVRLERVATKEPLITASPNESLMSVAMKMLENNIRHIPVVEGGRVLGVLSIRDVLRALIARDVVYP